MNYYEILQVTPEASEEVIKAAYKALVKKFHPDNGVINGNEKLQAINEAYNILSDPQSRRMYDERLKQNQGFSENEQYKETKNTEKDVKKESSEESTVDFDTNNEEESDSKIGKVFRSFFRGISKEMQRNSQVMENAYYDGLNMSDYELVHAFEKNYGFKRQGYAKVLEERELLVRDYEGKLRPTDKFKYYWR